MSSTTLSELPAEIIEAILSEISHPYDLVQLACASSLFRNLVIPRHIEYRILWLRTTSSSQFDFLWTHLLQRPNLTRNIWKVDMTEELTTNRLTPAPSKKVPLYPKTLIVDEKLDNSQNGSCRNTEALMLSALRLMVNLNSFTWRWATCTPSPDFLQFMFDIPSVQHVRLFSPYPIHTITEEISVNPPNDSPVLSLRIEGKQWTSSLLFNPILSWFRTMTSLQTLKICSRLLHQCDGVHFPVLRDLVLFMPFDQDPTRTISFLARHNTIEALKFPSSCKNISTVPSGILPNLKKLRCHFSLLQAMSKADIEDCNIRLLRPINDLILTQPKRFKDQDFCLFETGCLDRTKLQNLAIRRIESADSLKTLANLFPMLQDLWFSQFSKNPEMVEFVSTLQLFKDLKALRCRFIWHGLPDENYEDKLTERVEALGNGLPNLCQLGHPNSNREQVTITRGESITYNLSKGPV